MLRAATLPGLELQAATLLAGPLPGGLMLQVTPQVGGAGRMSAGECQHLSFYFLWQLEHG